MLRCKRCSSSTGSDSPEGQPRTQCRTIGLGFTSTLTRSNQPESYACWTACSSAASPGRGAHCETSTNARLWFARRRRIVNDDVEMDPDVAMLLP
jgi:hypothetical protein